MNYFPSNVFKFAFQEMLIHYHPETGRHLGLARLVFIQVKSARECVKFLHGKSVMGKQLNCYIDPFGASCKQVRSLTQHPFLRSPYFPKQGRRKQAIIDLTVRQVNDPPSFGGETASSSLPLNNCLVSCETVCL